MDTNANFDNSETQPVNNINNPDPVTDNRVFLEHKEKMKRERRISDFARFGVSSILFGVFYCL